MCNMKLSQNSRKSMPVHICCWTVVIMLVLPLFVSAKTLHKTHDNDSENGVDIMGVDDAEFSSKQADSGADLKQGATWRFADTQVCNIYENEPLHALMDRICELCHEMFSHEKPNMRAECRSDCFRSTEFKRCLRLFKPTMHQIRRQNRTKHRHHKKIAA